LKTFLSGTSIYSAKLPLVIAPINPPFLLSMSRSQTHITNLFLANASDVSNPVPVETC
jgi:hypothetical protein